MSSFWQLSALGISTKALVPIFIGYVLLVLSCWDISQRKTSPRLFWWSIFLMSFGVFGPLFIHILSPPPAIATTSSSDEYSFFRDSFLIVAAIGANFFASSIFNAEPGQRLLSWPWWEFKKKDNQVSLEGSGVDAKPDPIIVADVANSSALEDDSVANSTVVVPKS